MLHVKVSSGLRYIIAGHEYFSDYYFNEHARDFFFLLFSGRDFFLSERTDFLVGFDFANKFQENYGFLS